MNVLYAPSGFQGPVVMIRISGPAGFIRILKAGSFHSDLKAGGFHSEFKGRPDISIQISRAAANLSLKNM